MKWLKESNRWKHLLYSIPCGFLLTILFAIGVNVGMEYKDKLRNNKFDWLDILAGTIGGAIGQLLQIILILLCM